MGRKEVIRTPQQMVADDTPPTYQEWEQLIQLFLLVERDFNAIERAVPGFKNYVRIDGPNLAVARKHDNRYKSIYGPYEAG